MPRFRSRALLAVGACALVLSSLAIADTTAATSTTEPGSGAVGSTAVLSGADEAATASTPGAVGPATRYEPLPAGTYVSETFMPPLTYTVPEGWRMLEDNLGGYVLNPADAPYDPTQGLTVNVWRDVEAPSPEFCGALPVEEAGYSAQKITSWLASHEGLVATQPAPVTVGGLDGFMIDAVMSPSFTGLCLARLDEPIVWTLIGSGSSSSVHQGLTAAEAQRIYVLDLADGGNVAILINSCCDPKNGDLDNAEFQEAIANTTPIVESFQFDVSGLVEDTTVEVATTG
jgi:hypothetical protein